MRENASGIYIRRNVRDEIKAPTDIEFTIGSIASRSFGESTE